MAPRASAVLVAVAVNIGLGVIVVAAQAPAYSAPVVTGHHARPHHGPPRHQGGGSKHHGSPAPQHKPAPPPPPPPDTTPPATPTISGTTVAPHGQVTLAFSAEGGSFVSVHEGGSYVAGATASGLGQSLTWTAKGGRHSYDVTATDNAGNTSSSASVRVVVDVTPPSLSRVAVTAGDSADSRSQVSFTTDRGSRYRFLVDGKPTGPTTSSAGATGLARRAHVQDAVDVPNGHHRVTVQVLDKVGNVRTQSAPVSVDVTDLAVSTDVTSEPGRTRQVLKVTATPNATTATLHVPGHKPLRFPMHNGTGNAVLKLANGSYDNATVTVRDTQGRTGTSDPFTLTIDTTPPVLRVTADRDAAHNGQLEFTVSTDPGNVVEWRLLGANQREVASGTYAAGSGDENVQKDVPEGKFDLVVSATDRYDRTTTDVSSAAIGPNRLPTALLLFFIVGAAGLLTALAVGLAHLLRPRRAQIAAAFGRARVTIAALLQPALEEDDDEIPEPPAPVVYRAEEGDWARRRDMLRAFLDVAAGAERSLPELSDFFLLPEERLLYDVDGDLYEGMSDDELPEPSRGLLIVTTERVAFRGDADRDWWWALLERIEPEGATATLLQTWHNDSLAGVTYDNPEETRLYLELGRALQHGRPRPVIADATARLEEVGRHLPAQRPADTEAPTGSPPGSPSETTSGSSSESTKESPLDVGIWA